MDPIKIFAKSMAGEIHEFTLDPESPVMELKNKLSEIKNHPANQIKVIFAGAVLDSEKKILDYKIIDKSTVIYLCSNPKPVKPDPPKPEPEPEPMPENPADLGNMFFQFLSNPNLANMANMNFDIPQIKFTAAEKTDIDYIVNMGFTMEDAIQFYHACDKDKEKAINAIINSHLDDD